MANGKWNKRGKFVGIFLGLSLILIVCFSVLKVMYALEHIPLQGTWESQETGQILTFTDQGSVEFEGNLPNGIYHILSPNTMEYTIDKKTFIMNYRIDGQVLYWGTDENKLECFDKVWLR